MDSEEESCQVGDEQQMQPSYYKSPNNDQQQSMSMLATDRDRVNEDKEHGSGQRAFQEYTESLMSRQVQHTQEGFIVSNHVSPFECTRVDSGPPLSTTADTQSILQQKSSKLQNQKEA